MIAFATILLGLVLGERPIELLVGPEVAAVELLLDGRTAARLGREPWTAVIDLGDDLRPHELVAVAHDAGGTELGRARQWINLPHPPAEGEIFLEPAGDGEPRWARLVWSSVAAEDPLAVRASLDGSPFEIAEPRRFELPPHDPERLHFLRVELDFSDNVSSVVEATFGGAYTDRVSTELTAVPVDLDADARLPPLAELQDWFVKDGRPLRVLAVEEGPAEVVLVRDRTAQPAIDRLALERRRTFSSRNASRTLRFGAALRKDQRIHFLEPFADTSRRPSYGLHLFHPTPPFTQREGGLAWLLTTVRPRPEELAHQRLADAVAVAALSAAAADRRRAVVLVLGDEPPDSSQLSVAAARDYLASLRVPLRVWSPLSRPDGTAGAWGEARDISTLGKLQREVSDLARLLDRQRIVWIEGDHLPQQLALAAPVRGVALAR